MATFRVKYGDTTSPAYNFVAFCDILLLTIQKCLYSFSEFEIWLIVTFL